MKVQSQLVNIKVERKLMSRFLVAARSTSEINLPGYLGKYEFPAVVESSDEPEYKAIIFDGMAVANKVDIKKLKLSTCSEYAAEYVKKVVFESRGFNEVRIIFDRYIEESLKAGTRSGRTGGETARYR